MLWARGSAGFLLLGLFHRATVVWALVLISWNQGKISVMPLYLYELLIVTQCEATEMTQGFRALAEDLASIMSIHMDPVPVDPVLPSGPSVHCTFMAHIHA